MGCLISTNALLDALEQRWHQLVSPTYRTGTIMQRCLPLHRCIGTGAEGRLLARGLGRTVSRGVMLAHAAEGFRFINFDRVQTTGSGPQSATR